MLIYGDPGSGKTRLVAKSPGKTLIVRPATDHTDSIDVGDDVDEWVVRRWKDMDEVLDYARQGAKGEYTWIWLDSLSLWQYSGLDDLWDIVTTENPRRLRYGLDKSEYGINMHRIGNWTRAMVGLADEGHFNFGITCHVRDTPPSESESDDSEKKMPWVQGKNMPQATSGYMNVVALLEQSGAHRYLRLSETDKFYAKDQFYSTEGKPLKDEQIDTIFTRIEGARATPAATPKRRRRTTKPQSRS